MTEPETTYTGHPSFVAPDEHAGPKRHKGDRKRKVDWITCSGCDNHWTGLAVMHCSKCHRTFTGISAFDLHRTGSHAASTRTCLDPVTVFNKAGEHSLVEVTRQYWSGWGCPGDDTRFENEDILGPRYPRRP
jgi:hypothetical protein